MMNRPHGVRQLQVRTEPIHPHDKQHLAQAQGPSVTKILTVMSLLPIGGTLLTLAGLTFAGTMTGLAVTFPLFILFSPVLVPAVLVIGLAVAATLTSGAFGVTALSCLSWALNSFWKATGSMPEQIEQAERRLQDVKGYVGQKTKEFGDTVESKAQEARRSPSRS